MLTTAVFAVILSAPAGAILVNSLGKQLLTYDGDPKDMTKSDYQFKFGDAEDKKAAEEIEMNKVGVDNDNKIDEMNGPINGSKTDILNNGSSLN